MAHRFPPRLTERFANTYEIDIVTWSYPGAQVHNTVIWVVLDEDGTGVYVRSVRGERGRWYRQLLVNPDREAVLAGEWWLCARCRFPQRVRSSARVQRSISSIRQKVRTCLPSCAPKSS